jgi:hypothetical protein
MSVLRRADSRLTIRVIHVLGLVRPGNCDNKLVTSGWFAELQFKPRRGVDLWDGDYLQSLLSYSPCLFHQYIHQHFSDRFCSRMFLELCHALPPLCRRPFRESPRS